MVKADLGTKRVCPSCGARFYDLSKRPIECPKCSFAFEPEALYKQRRRQPEAAESQVPANQADDEENEEEETAEAEETLVERVADEPELDTGDDDSEEEEEIVADEPEHADGMSVVEGEDAALEDLDDEDVEDADDDDLLEEVEDDDDDVSDIIDADIEKDER